MTNYKYILEPYNGLNSRFSCPNCKSKNQFAKYIDRETGNYLSPIVGRCNREDKCGYHYTPKQYFLDNKIPDRNNHNWKRQIEKPKIEIVPKPISLVPNEILEATLNNYADNKLVIFLENLFGNDLSFELVKKYLIGTSKHWEGATVFWQVDFYKKIRTGKIILYNAVTGGRIKEPYNHISWAHYVLKLEGFHLSQCLFGEHLLIENPMMPIAIVESEKTAMIASIFLPEFLWLATGSKANLTVDKCKVLAGRKIFLFPDINCHDEWSAKAKEIKRVVRCEIKVSDFLEKNATLTERENGFDLADYLIKRDSNFGWALSPDDYPKFWD